MIDWDRIDTAPRYDLHDWVTNIAELVLDHKRRILLGIYDEEHDGDLLTVLEEIERILR